MRVLLADKLSASVVDRLTVAGCEVTNSPELKGDTLTEALTVVNPHVLVVRSTKVFAHDLSAAPALELIVRAGAGYDNIDVSGASGLGIFVANCPGKNAAAVAELAIGLMLSLDRSLPDNVIDAREGRWNKALYGKAAGLKGRTLSLIGLGNIGRGVAERARGLDMKVAAWSRSLTPERTKELNVTFCATPLEAAAMGDVVSLHCASNADTHQLADRAFFEAMKEGAFFINTTRHAVVDEEALRWAMDSKGVRAALDVFSDEPAVKTGEFSHPLAQHPSVYISHHIGASTQQAQEAIAAEAARVIETYADSGDVPNCVNLAVKSPATHQLTVRHLDRVGVLAKVLDEVSKANWNVQEMENVVFDEGKAACAYIRFVGSADESVVDRIRSMQDVLAVTLITL